jgi:hypothetical protein
MNRRVQMPGLWVLYAAPPPLPVRQWVLSLPKRLRYFLRNDRRTVTAVLKILLRVVEEVPRERAIGGHPQCTTGDVHQIFASVRYPYSVIVGPARCD